MGKPYQSGTRKIKRDVVQGRLTVYSVIYRQEAQGNIFRRFNINRGRLCANRLGVYRMSVFDQSPETIKKYLAATNQTLEEAKAELALTKKLVEEAWEPKDDLPYDRNAPQQSPKFTANPGLVFDGRDK